jgi:hypothetical protein
VKSDEKLLDWIIGLLTIAILAAQLCSHSPRAKQVARQTEDMIRYHVRRFRFWLRHVDDPGWKKELQDYVETIPLPTPK